MLLTHVCGRQWRRPADPPAAHSELARLLAWFWDGPGPAHPFSLHSLVAAGRKFGCVPSRDSYGLVAWHVSGAAGSFAGHHGTFLRPAAACAAHARAKAEPAGTGLCCTKHPSSLQQSAERRHLPAAARRIVPGEWLGPWTLCHALQEAVNAHEPAGLHVHLANTPGGVAPVLYTDRS